MTDREDSGERLHERAGSGSLARVVRSRRRDLRLTQADLADLAGVSERFVHAVETAKTTVQFDKLLVVLSALGLHLELARGAGEEIGIAAVVDPAGS